MKQAKPATPEEQPAAHPVAALDEPFGAVPPDPQALPELPELPAPARRAIEVVDDQSSRVGASGLEEALFAELLDQAEHGPRIEVPGLLQSLDDQLADRARAVHALHQGRFPRLELQVQGVVGPGRDRIVVAPTQPEQLDLDAVCERRDERLGIQEVVQLLPEIPLSLGR
jgi:hypothetical protein